MAGETRATLIVTSMQRPRLPGDLIPRQRLPAQDSEGLAQAVQQTAEILRIPAFLRAAWNVEGGARMTCRFRAGAVSLAVEHLGHRRDSVDL